MSIKDGMYSEHYNKQEKMSALYNNFSAFGTKSYVTVFVEDKESGIIEVERINVKNLNK